MENLQCPMWIEDPDGYLMWDDVKDTYVKKPAKKESKKFRNVVIVAASTAGVIFTAAAGYLFYSRKNPIADGGDVTPAKPNKEN